MQLVWPSREHLASYRGLLLESRRACPALCEQPFFSVLRFELRRSRHGPAEVAQLPSPARGCLPASNRAVQQPVRRDACRRASPQLLRRVRNARCRARLVAKRYLGSVALDVNETSPSHHFTIRLAQAADVALLPGIEDRAAVLFDGWRPQTGLTDEERFATNSLDTFERAHRAGRLWVAVSSAGEVVGFALITVVGGAAHLEELDVLPLHGRRGIGSALVDAVCSWAARAGYAAVTLRTFRDVPWNRPFYERKGFRVVASSALSSEHVQLETAELERGLRTDLRVSMTRSTAGSVSR
jgi:GNAT superfamily N-acetyltransferase